jgi:hypothetical protein
MGMDEDLANGHEVLGSRELGSNSGGKVLQREFFYGAMKECTENEFRLRE